METVRVRNNQAPRDGEWGPGWPTLLAGFCGMATGWNFTTVVASLFIKPMQAEFGWTRTELSFAPIAGLIVAFLMPLTGLLLDRFGARRIALIGLIAMAAAFAVFAIIPASRLFFYAAVLLLGVAGSLSNSIVMARGTTPWFRRNLGLAIGLMMTGASVSAAIVVPLLSLVIQHSGWRAGFVSLAGLTLLFGLIPAVVWFHEPTAAQRPPDAEAPVRHPMGLIARTAAFWKLVGACGIAALPIGGFIGHLIPLLTDRGLTAAGAAGFGSLFALAIGSGRIVNGFLLDRVHPPLVTGITLLLASTGAALLWLVGVGFGWALTAAAIALIGLAQGAEGDYIKFFSMRLFGLGNFARVVAIMAMTISLGMAFGGLLFAWIFDRYGSYSPAIVGSIMLYAVGAAIFFSIRMAMPLRSVSGLPI